MYFRTTAEKGNTQKKSMTVMISSYFLHVYHPMLALMSAQSVCMMISVVIASIRPSFAVQMTTVQKAKRDRAVMKNGGVLKTGIIRHKNKGMKIYEQEPEESETV